MAKRVNPNTTPRYQPSLKKPNHNPKSTVESVSNIPCTTIPPPLPSTVGGFPKTTLIIATATATTTVTNTTVTATDINTNTAIATATATATTATTVSATAMASGNDEMQKQDQLDYFYNVETVSGFPVADLDFFCSPHIRNVIEDYIPENSWLPEIMKSQNGGTRFFKTSELLALFSDYITPSAPTTTTATTTPSELRLTSTIVGKKEEKCLNRPFSMQDILDSINATNLEDTEESDGKKNVECIQSTKSSSSIPAVPKFKQKTTVPLGFEFKATMRALSEKIGHGVKMVAKEVGFHKKRNFGLVWYPHFLKDLYYRMTDLSARTFHETIGEEEPCRFYLDIDLELQNPCLDTGKTIERLKTFKRTMGGYIIRFMKTILMELANGFELQNSGHFNQNQKELSFSWLVLDSSNCTKFSQHIILKLNNDSILFKNRRSVGNYIKRIISQELTDNIFRDPKDSFVNQKKNLKAHPFSIFLEKKDKALKAQWEFGKYYSATPSVQTGVSDVPYALLLNTIDVGIYYGEEREFRMFTSTKPDGDRILKYSSKWVGTLIQNDQDQLKIATIKPVKVTQEISYMDDGDIDPFVWTENSQILTEPTNDLDLEDFLTGDDSTNTKANSHIRPFETKFQVSKEFVVFSELFYDSLVVPFFHSSTNVPSLSNDVKLLLHCLNPIMENQKKVENMLEMRKKLLNSLLSKRVAASSSKIPQKVTAKLPPIKVMNTNGEIINKDICGFFKSQSGNPFACLRGDYMPDEEVSEHLSFVLNDIFGDDVGHSENDDGDENLEDLTDENENFDGNDEKVKKRLARELKLDGDDLLGLHLIQAIATNIELKRGILQIPKARLSFKNEKITDGIHTMYFLVKEDRRCQIKALMTGDPDAHHKNNNMYYVVRLNDCIYYQKCFDPTCRTYYATYIAKENPKNTIAHELAAARARGDLFTLDQSLHRRIQNHRQRDKIFLSLSDKLKNK